MIKLIRKLPRTINLAFSGGVDSYVAAHFLSNNHNVTLLHFNHGCEHSDQIEAECRDVARSLELPILVGKLTVIKPEAQSLEDFWRRQRYGFLRSFPDRFVTCHHLDDAVETWIWSSLHGEGKVIPVEDEKVIRPFLTTPKADFVAYAQKHSLIPVDDPYNREYDLTRNYIRANIIPHAMKVNPGLHKVIRKKYLISSDTK